MDAKPAFANPPYHVETIRGAYKGRTWETHIVCNVDGVNCLTYPDKPGAIFAASKEHADQICAQWNGN